jgi:hypothetical protein
MATAAEQRIDIREKRASLRAASFAPYILGLYFAVSALWGVGRTDVVDTDAARHAMNGAFIFDMVRTGHTWDPVEYGQEYYGHLPALSMPYHPPLFPAVEAIFYAIFGVKLFTARLAVAMGVFAAAVLLFRLIERSLGNSILAGCVTVTMCSLWVSVEVARDVMLEYPALAFMLAAACCLTTWDKGFSTRQAIGFAIFAALAFWTKQHAVLIGGIPPLYSILTGRWKLLLRLRAMLTLVLFAGAVLGYVFLAAHFHNAGVQEAAASKDDLKWIVLRTIPAYATWIAEDFDGITAVFGICSVVLYLVGCWRGRHEAPVYKLGMYWCWILSAVVILVDSGNTNRRYLFFLYPAVLAISYAGLFQGAYRLWGRRYATAIVLAFGCGWFLHAFVDPIEFLRGPGDAAKAVIQDRPTRVLYAGEADGNFIFAARALDSKLQTTVIPAGKLEASKFQPEALEAFCRMYGIDWIVLENVPGNHRWSNLRNNHWSFLSLQQSFPLESTRERWHSGTVDVFRVLGSSTAPGGVLKIPIRRFGVDIDVKL